MYILYIDIYIYIYIYFLNVFIRAFIHALFLFVFILLLKIPKLKTFFIYFTIMLYHVSRKLTVDVRAIFDMFRLVVTLPSPISNSIIEISARGVILLSKVVEIRRFISGMCFFYYIIYISLLFFYFSYNIFN